MANSQAKEGTLLVLLALGETSGKDGLTRATTDDLKRWCRISARQVSRALSELKAKGEIAVVQAGGGRGKSARYRILLKWEKRFYQGKKTPKTRRVNPDTGIRGLDAVNYAVRV